MTLEKDDGSETGRDSKVSTDRKLTYIFSLLAVLLFGAFVFQLWYFAVRASATVDEPAHILAGYRHWQCGDFGINPEHPPMLKMMATAPLRLRTLSEPPWECGSRWTSKNELFLHGTKFVIQNGVEEILFPARVISALFSALLAILVFASVWRMFGRRESLTALAILAFEPNLIANGVLVTTDMTITATAFAAVLAVYGYCRKPNWRRVLLAGAAIGLLLAAKHSAVILIPVLCALMTADALLFRVPEKPLAGQFLRRLAAFAGMFAIGLMILWAFYGFRYQSLPGEGAPAASVAEYIAANGRPEARASLSAKIVHGVSRTRIFPESYMIGLADIIAYGNRNMYLFGNAYATGRWFYFPVSFLVKSSVALLVLLPLGIAFAFLNAEKRREMMFLLAPPLVFFAAAMTSGTNIGVRHILPVYPFFIVAAAVGAIWACGQFPAFRYFLIALLLFHGVTTAFRVAPDYMPFVNDFWGGPDNAHKIYRDPNLDFGQNNKFVKEYLERENITDCWFAPHGNFELVAEAQPCRLLPGSFGFNISDRLNEPAPPVIEGTVLLTAQVFPPRGGREYLPFTQSAPVAVIGRGIFVYRGRFEIPLVAALSHVERVNQLIRLKRFDEALVDGQRAAELAPDDPRPHIAYGQALLRAGQKEAARRAGEKATAAQATNPVLLRIPEMKALQELKEIDGN